MACGDRRQGGQALSQLGNNIEFSADEKHVLYRADTPGGQLIVVDGVENDPRPVIEENSYGFSPDGRHVAYIAWESRDEQFVVVDNKNGKTYEDVGIPTPAFTNRRLLSGLNLKSRIAS